MKKLLSLNEAKYSDCYQTKTAVLLTILLLISWKWISHTLSTTLSLSNVTNANPATANSKANLLTLHGKVSISLISSFLTHPTQMWVKCRGQDCQPGFKVLWWGWSTFNHLFPVSVTLIADSHEVYQEIIHHREEYEMLLLGPNRVKLVKVKAE